MSNNLIQKIFLLYPHQDKNKIFKSGRSGYWSNLSKNLNKKFNNKLKNGEIKKLVKSIIPEFENMIFSEKREGALELLNHDKKGICIDYGCMWGVLSVGMAKRGHSVLAIDKTYESLFFLKKRIDEENIKNIHLIQDDIKKTKFSKIADFAVINGVLEWVPTSEQIEIELIQKKNYIPNFNNKGSPENIQKKFLSTVFKSLKKNGEMLLAIENRHSYQYYMGKKDPHSNLLFTTFLPRFFSNIISHIFHKKPYRTYIYSITDMKKMIMNAGFKHIETYISFPDYHFPEMILHYSDAGIKKYNKYPNSNRITFKQKLAYYVEYFLMKYLKAKFFAPSIIIVAKK